MGVERDVAKMSVIVSRSICVTIGHNSTTCTLNLVGPIFCVADSRRSEMTGNGNAPIK